MLNKMGSLCRSAYFVYATALSFVSVLKGNTFGKLAYFFSLLDSELYEILFVQDHLTGVSKASRLRQVSQSTNRLSFSLRRALLSTQRLHKESLAVLHCEIKQEIQSVKCCLVLHSSVHSRHCPSKQEFFILCQS